MRRGREGGRRREGEREERGKSVSNREIAHLQLVHNNCHCTQDLWLPRLRKVVLVVHQNGIQQRREEVLPHLHTKGGGGWVGVGEWGSTMASWRGQSSNHVRVLALVYPARDELERLLLDCSHGGHQRLLRNTLT